MSSSVRPAAVAGVFYPDDPNQLVGMVDADVGGAEVGPDAPVPPKAIVAPHAGYVYSGPIAGTAYATITPLRGTVERVVLLGPAHRVPLRGMAVPSVDAFDSPLGPVPVDEEARRLARACDGVVIDDRPHAGEHSLEVHLPFLQRVLGTEGWKVLPVVVGHARATDVACVIEELWGGPETLVVVSTDLSHYHDDATARRLDRATADAVLARDLDHIGPEDACGAYPLRGLLLVAQRKGLAVTLLDLRNSSDTAGDPDRVVGYGAFALA